MLTYQHSLHSHSTEMDKKRIERRVVQKEEKRLKREAEGVPAELPPLSESDHAEAVIRREERDARIQKERDSKSSNSFKILIDCGFTEQMSAKESSSMGLQLMYCYAFNKRNSVSPVHYHVSELNGPVSAYLNNLAGYKEGNWEKLYHASEKKLETIFKAEEMVYLTADSENEIEELDDSKVYVIGGIVDRNRLKMATV